MLDKIHNGKLILKTEVGGILPTTFFSIPNSEQILIYQDCGSEWKEEIILDKEDIIKLYSKVIKESD